jgi:hypothetical protein
LQVRTAEDAATLQAVEQAVGQNLLDFATAVQQEAPEFGAEAMPCAGGTAAFLGVGSPLTTVKGAGPDLADEDLDTAELFFRRLGAETAVFELAPWVSAERTQRLCRRGYKITGSEDVVVRRPPFDSSVPHLRVVPVASGKWPDLMKRMNGLGDDPHWHAVIEASARLSGAVHFCVLDGDDGAVACAQIFPVGNVALFANDATLVSARGRGAQAAVIQARLRMAAMRPFWCAAAEVAPESGSERNYLRSGFHVAYTRIHYARKLC